jgi:hypothetical protein
VSARQWQLLALGYVLICAAIAAHLYLYPSQVHADASAYVDLALGMRARGLFGLFSALDPARTYGYVWFLYFCSLLFGTGREALVWGAGILQAALYAAAVLSLAATIAHRSRPLAHATRIGLLFNPILMALVMDTMSESLTLIVAIVLLTVLLRCATAPTFARKRPWLIGGAAIASFALMIRPANLSLLAAWNVAVLPILFDATAKSTWRNLRSYAVIVVAVSALVWAPQLVISARQFGHASIYPASLGDFQITMGLKLVKYATKVGADHVAAGLPYPNPWLTELPATPSWRWYFSDPVKGALTAASHVFNALNYDHPFVYIYDASLPWSIPLAFICWMIYALAVADAAIGLGRWRDLRFAVPEFAPGALFLTTMTAATLATVSISAVESRFSTLIFAIAGVLACHCALRINGLSGPQRSRIAVAAVVVGVFGVLVSEWMKSLLKFS